MPGEPPSADDAPTPVRGRPPASTSASASAATSAERLLAALDALELAAADNIGRAQEIQRRLGELRVHLEAGRPLHDAIAAESEPRTVELLTANIDSLHGVGAQLRAAQAQALRDEGMSIAAVADLFGVTRQRVSALLKQKSATTPIE